MRRKKISRESYGNSIHWVSELERPIFYGCVCVCVCVCAHVRPHERERERMRSFRTSDLFKWGVVATMKMKTFTHITILPQLTMMSHYVWLWDERVLIISSAITKKQSNELHLCLYMAVVIWIQFLPCH